MLQVYEVADDDADDDYAADDDYGSDDDDGMRVWC